MPYRVLHALALVMALLSELFLLLPFRLFSRIPRTSRIAQHIPGRIYTRFPFRENVVGWFDRLGAPVTHYFSKDDVYYMLVEAGFENVEVVARPGASASWTARGIRARPTP